MMGVSSELLVGLVFLCGRQWAGFILGFTPVAVSFLADLPFERSSGGDASLDFLFFLDCFIATADRRQSTSRSRHSFRQGALIVDQTT
jgi:hypothetical protein